MARGPARRPPWWTARPTFACPDSATEAARTMETASQGTPASWQVAGSACAAESSNLGSPARAPRAVTQATAWTACAARARARVLAVAARFSARPAAAPTCRPTRVTRAPSVSTKARSLADAPVCATGSAGASSIRRIAPRAVPPVATTRTSSPRPPPATRPANVSPRPRAAAIPTCAAAGLACVAVRRTRTARRPTPARTAHAARPGSARSAARPSSACPDSAPRAFAATRTVTARAWRATSPASQASAPPSPTAARTRRASACRPPARPAEPPGCAWVGLAPSSTQAPFAGRGVASRPRR